MKALKLLLKIGALIAFCSIPFWIHDNLVGLHRNIAVVVWSAALLTFIAIEAWVKRNATRT